MNILSEELLIFTASTSTLPFFSKLISALKPLFIDTSGLYAAKNNGHFSTVFNTV